MSYSKEIKPTVGKASLKDMVNKEREKSQQQRPESKYEEALKQYNTDLDDREVAEAVRKLIAEKVPENDTTEVKRFLFGSVELTSLHTTDSEESILAMTEKVNDFDATYPDLPHVATICVYPCFAKIVSQSLEIDGVEIACVSGSFPSSQTFQEVKVAETALALKDGATEIDIVLPVGKFLSGDYEGVSDDINELKQVCGSHSMKVILETGDLKTASNIKKAAIIAMYAGADYIKTSTGKEKISATPEAAYVMCQAIKEYYDKTGIQIGFKPAGGINTVMDAVIYYTIVKEVLGEKWLTNKWFRLGTSRLANLLLSEILGEETKFF
jgi:deoxyribose-phosphate aldolase